jgi:hypothetical protein
MPTFDAAATADTNSSGAVTTAAVNHTCGSNSNRVVYAALCTDNATVTSITATYGGNAMTSVGTAAVSDQKIYLYRYIAPASGVNACNWSWTNATGYAFLVFSYYDVHQTSPERAALVTAGSVSSANPSLSVTSVLGDLVIAMLNYNNSDSITDGSSQTRDAAVLQGNNGITAAILNSKAGSTGSVPMSWTAAAQRWGAFGFSLQPPAAAATAAYPFKPQGASLAPLLTM